MFASYSQLTSCTGMALAPWNVLAGGKIRTDEEEDRRRKTGEKGECAQQASLRASSHRSDSLSRSTVATLDWERTEDQRRVCKALEEVAQQVGAKSIQAGE